MNQCAKLEVTAVIVNGGEVVGRGENTPVRPCDDVTCHVDGHCVNTNHAEVEAILRAHDKTEGATMFVSHEPCSSCRKIIISSGIKRVIYHEEKYDELNYRFKGNVEWIHEPLRGRGHEIL